MMNLDESEKSELGGKVGNSNDKHRRISRYIRTLMRIHDKAKIVLQSETVDATLALTEKLALDILRTTALSQRHAGEPYTLELPEIAQALKFFGIAREDSVSAPRLSIVQGTCGVVKRVHRLRGENSVELHRFFVEDD